MERARGHSGKHQTRHIPTGDNDLLARAIAFGLMERVRDEKIAQRAAPAATVAQADAQDATQDEDSQESPASSASSESDPFDESDEEVRPRKVPRLSRKDKGKAKATSALDDGDTEMGDERPADESDHGSMGQGAGFLEDHDIDMGLADYASSSDEEIQAEDALSLKEKADKEAADKWVAERFALNAFNRNMSPSPTRGHINN